MTANIKPTRSEPANASFRPPRPARRDRANPFATIVGETIIPTIITDPSGVDNPIVFANPAFCRLTGYRLAEILGRNCRFLQGPGTDPATLTRIAASLRARQPIEVDIRNYRKNGTPFLNRLLIAPVHTRTGALAYFFATQIDVTDEHDAAHDKLQAALNERGRVKAALEHLHAIESICLLGGGIAHNFRNLLGGIRGSLASLQRDIAVAVKDRSATSCSTRTE
jgi:PAS domain S-box-containing protein